MLRTKLFPLAALMIFSLFSCKSTKQHSSSMDTDSSKALLIDGNWEANYVMNAPRPFDELYAEVKPSMTFNSKEKRVGGVTGCNNFTGSFTIEGNRLHFDENMALTRKMCRDMAGEDLFVATLRKVNGYSVSDQGKTLNLLTGDIAVMRLVRK